MSPELIGILGVGVTLGALVATQSRAIRAELREAGRERSDLRERLARLEGLLEGLLRRRDTAALEPARPGTNKPDLT